MAAYVLDASALIAFLRREPGAETVERVLADCSILAVNWSEVVASFARGTTPPDAVRSTLAALSPPIIPFDAELAVEAGLMAQATRSAGLSLGDRACLALAKRLGVPALTADRAWATIAEAAAVEIVLIR